MRDHNGVATKLRELADQVENQTLGALSLNNLGNVFGNEFWNLIYWNDNRDILQEMSESLRAISNAITEFYD